jgi:peptidoglycan-associated lipoprotein
MFRKVLLLMMGAIMVAAAGCAKRQVVKPSETPTAQAEKQKPAVTPEEQKNEASVRYTDWTAAPETKTVYFDYDTAELRADSRDTLKANAEYLKSNQDLNVLVEGYCDERGTVEYNLALGQKRASAVREYYGQLGVPLSRIGTISYGAENPVDAGHNESAWAKNRRAETKVRNNK